MGAGEKAMNRIPITKPTLPSLQSVQKSIASFYDTGMITNGAQVKKLEQEARSLFGVDHAIAVSSCTNGLMLALRCLGLNGSVAVPSFTFFATAHAIVWNGLEPVFTDVDPETWDMSSAALEGLLRNRRGISVIMPVHVFGNPCDVDAIASLSNQYNIPIIYDSAHAFGSEVGGRSVGVFGNAEIFSLTPTKLVPAGEGGIITTNDADFAEELTAGRNYGNKGDYNPAFVGLSARLSEFNAALGIGSISYLKRNVERRNRSAARYIELLSSLPGVSFQKIDEGNRSTYKDFTILINENEFGINRDILSWFLGSEGIDTRKYFYPPVHRTAAYWEKWGEQCDEALPITNRISREVLSLPMWSHMDMEIIEMVSKKIKYAHNEADRITASYSESAQR